jgi:uncharacterized C2H2 Zn-finger protein
MRKTCIYCGKVYKSRHILSQHVNKYHPNIKIKCRYIQCGHYFLTKDELEHHFKQQHRRQEDKKKYQCSKCSYKCKAKQNLIWHYKNVHKNNAKLLCPKCPNVFKSSRTLKYHWKTKHIINSA